MRGKKSFALNYGPTVRSRRDLTPVVTTALILLGPLICFYYLSCEQAFYSWDQAHYHNMARAAAAAFGQGWGEGWRHVRASLPEDYNALFALPLLPFLSAFGTQRGVYLSAVYLVYVLPLLFVSGALLRRLFPSFGNTASWVGALMAFLSPAYWRTLLRGYPDTCGATLVATAALLHVGRRSGPWRWRTSVLIGLALGGSVVLRRHYAYAVVAFYAALAIDAAWLWLEATPDERATRLASLGRRAAQLALSGCASLAFVLVVTPGFAARAIDIAISRVYASYEWRSALAAQTVLDTVGGIPSLLAIAGLVLLWRTRSESRPAIRFLGLYALIWLAVWTLHVRQAAYHYPHAIPLVVIVGNGALLLGLAERTHGRRRWLGVAGASFLLVAMLAQAVSGARVFAPLHGLPRAMKPMQFRPLWEPGIQEISALVAYLREVGGPGARVVVGASSERLNYDLLANAEATLFPGARRLLLSTTPQVDSLGLLPTAEFLDADFVIVATPIQHHIAVGRQRVIEVVVAAFDRRWEVSNDFELLPREFLLPPTAQHRYGVEIRVYRRLRPASLDTARRTAERVSLFVTGDEPPPSAWYAIASAFKTKVQLNADGSASLMAHPARRGVRPQTTFETGPVGRAAQLSGVVGFYDARCVGAELAVTTDAPGAEPRSIGAFTPAQGRTPFRTRLDGADWHAIRLIVRSAPSQPKHVDFCTMRIDALRADPIP